MTHFIPINARSHMFSLVVITNSTFYTKPTPWPPLTNVGPEGVAQTRVQVPYFLGLYSPPSTNIKAGYLYHFSPFRQAGRIKHKLEKAKLWSHPSSLPWDHPEWSSHQLDQVMLQLNCSFSHVLTSCVLERTPRCWGHQDERHCPQGLHRAFRGDRQEVSVG